MLSFVTPASAGTLALGGATVGGLGSGAVTDNATLAFTEPSAVVFGNSITGTGGVTQTGPGTCTDTWAGSSCSGPGIPLAFQLTSITCDDDLCDVAQIETGDAKSGDIVTIVPKACSVTVHVVATTGSLTESASLVVATTCAPGAADTSCFPP